MIIGVDEAGRGCLAGDVVAAAVILPDGFVLQGLTDSKKISATKRNNLFVQITQSCQYAIGTASAFEIDKINILQASLLAMQRAVKGLEVSYDRVLVDGNRCPKLTRCTAIIKGDLTHPVISAASIVAKVTRDRQMLALDKQYPQYGFAKHKSYGTQVHLLALAKYGVIDGLHRQSFAPVKRASMA